MFQDPTTLAGVARLEPGVEHSLTVHTPSTPLHVELTNRGPATAAVSLVDQNGVVTRQELAAGAATFRADADTEHVVLHLASDGTATVQYLIRTPSGCRLEWRYR